ncbi:MAG: class I SAM-dependent methyltransferase, partial [Anaerolineae bacterium]
AAAGDGESGANQGGGVYVGEVWKRTGATLRDYWLTGTGKMQDKIGARWEQILRGKGYALTGDEHFLRRFQASPYITTVLRYAHLEPGSLILEPGCGSGKFSLVLASLGHRVIALDYVNDVLQGVRATQERLGERWPGRLRGLCQGSLEHLPFPDNTFDLVMNEGVVEHWLDDRERLMALREMVRVTRPGGVVAVIVPNGAHPLIKIWESRLAGFFRVSSNDVL